jgi:N-methylhydantoinase A/oxoprolinase/acetone carboxylase beta subunit
VYSSSPPARAHAREKQDGASEPVERRRDVYFGPHGLVSTPIVERRHLAAGTTLEGPVVVQQADTTVVVHPGWRARADRSGQLVVERI